MKSSAGRARVIKIHLSDNSHAAAPYPCRRCPAQSAPTSLRSRRTLSARSLFFSLACCLFRFPSQIKLPQKNLEFAFSFSLLPPFLPSTPPRSAHIPKCKRTKRPEQSVTSNETQNQTVNHPTELSCLRSLSRIIFAFFLFFLFLF